jgi:hypothetical protein
MMKAIATATACEPRQEVQRGLDEGGKRGLADPAKTERGEGDPQLRRRQVGIESLRGPQHSGGHRVAFFNQLLDPAPADSNQREFSSDKEAVEENKNDHSQQLARRDQR